MVKNKNPSDREIKLKPKEKLVKALIENKDPQSILSLSGSAIMDYKNTYNLVNELSPVVVSKEKIGNTSLVKINLTPNPEIFNVEYKRTKEFLSKNPRLKVIKSYIEELDYPFMIALVFGSYAKGKNTPSSDIDLCIISDNQEKTKAILDRLNLLSLRLEIHKFTTDEFISMIEKSQRNLGHEIVKSNIILYGMENYYNLISKWMKRG